MTIQWFPGHMQETELFLKKAVHTVDVVMEIVDARLPVASSNPLLDQICKSVLRIKVLNKKDLADSAITNLWLSYFSDICSINAIAINGTDTTNTWNALEFAISKFYNLDLKKSNHTTAAKLKSRRLRVMVAGIPNTGKSTIMNTLAGKKVAKIGNSPAITKHNQRTSLKNGVDIYDTPGVLPPVLKNQENAFRLAAIGAISDAAIDYSDIAMFTLEYLIENYPAAIKSRYNLENHCVNFNDYDNKFENSIDDNRIKILQKIGAERGCLKKGGIIDLQKVSELIIRELRVGKIGRISLESPENYL